MSDMPPTIPADLMKTLRSAGHVTVLTGAGISAESGIPTFRDSQTGLWAQYDPHQLATPQAFQQNPHLVMEWYRWRLQLVEQSIPNPGHLALVGLERHFKSFTLVTQNIDGLHRTAGSINVIELHGNLRRLRCSQGDHGEYSWPAPDGLLTCPVCGSYLRPDVVWFGETIPRQALSAAVDATHDCNVFFSIGTSGIVEPAASLPYEALRSKAVVVEINPAPTPLTVYAGHYFPYPAGVVLPEILHAIQN